MRAEHLLRLAILTLVAFLPEGVFAKDAEWHRYENGYFIAYSDASAKKTRSILEGLEKFRVAASQAANVRVPESAAKTEVLIFDSRKDYFAISPGKNTSAFALSGLGQFRIVMRASGQSDTDLQIVRHEYTHVLLGYLSFQYPKWYDEGFAELVSTIRFIKKDSQFVMGEPPLGVLYSRGDGFDWNRLVAEGWNNETMHSGKVNDAYMQSWLLTHYAMIGNEFENYEKFLQYLRAWVSGEPPLSAFEQAFGMDANSLWKNELKSYSRNVVALVYDFESEELDMNFTRSVADSGHVRSVIDEISANVIRVR